MRQQLSESMESKIARESIEISVFSLFSMSSAAIKVMQPLQINAMRDSHADSELKFSTF